MLMDVNAVAAETRAVEYLQDQNRNYGTLERVERELRTFDLPPSIWWTMFSAYAIFFTAITLAMGGEGSALFMIVISIGYTFMYFGTAAALNSVGSDRRSSAKPGAIDTATGMMSYGAAYAQILTVPLLIAFFGCVIAVITSIVT